ncbi:metallophosphoesterase [Scytonema sp. UIC 10036]|uniref:metallophosphoesterase n=1 Tax=Scytonema sp. UIC 10036 TaxID=2304196 RepID=UPI0012DAD8AF|nr:metallophosphoesterase [Scytonema sp. UIC 10036]MUG98130.1 metallophosphoesterase [Scytonema sp. UIC 10036]
MLTRKKKRKCLFILLAIAVSFCVLILYAFIVEPNRFVVTRHQLNEQFASQKNSFKIVQISDLHLKEFNNRAQHIAEKVNKLNPNIVIFTGDSIDKVEQLDGFARFLSLLNRQTAKYAIMGNWEYWAGVDLKRLTEIYATYNCRLLINESILHNYGNDSILITGLDDLVSQPDLIKSLEGFTPQQNHLLLAHSPAYRDSLSSSELVAIAQYKPQYMLSGHTHGGQLSLFGFAPIRPNGSGRYVSGWYRDGAVALYVSRGLGVSILPVRMGVVPELGYFEWFLNSA